MQVLVDKTKADAVLGKLLGAYLEKDYPFNQPGAIPPQIKENLPRSLPWGGREHSLFLFALCYWMRGGIKSHTATRSLGRLYRAEPEIFLPETVDSISADHLANHFSRVGLGFNAEETGRGWKTNLERIRDQWAGDPRTLFHEVSTYEDACDRIQNRRTTGFYGFQHKMVSMLTYFYMHADIIDQWKFPIPVDFHVLRTVFSHGIIRVVEGNGGSNGLYTKPVLAATRQVFMDYAVEHNVSPVHLCEAVWIFSGIMCNLHPGNRSEGGSSKVRYGRKTKVVPVARWTPSQQKAYDRTCAVCVVSRTCDWSIAAADYYIGGKIVLREPRESAPQRAFPILPPPSTLQPRNKGRRVKREVKNESSDQPTLFSIPNRTEK